MRRIRHERTRTRHRYYEMKRVCYYLLPRQESGWSSQVSPDLLDDTLCTHVLVGALAVTAEGRLVPILRKHEDIITKIAATKLKIPYAKMKRLMRRIRHERTRTRHRYYEMKRVCYYLLPRQESGWSSQVSPDLLDDTLCTHVLVGALAVTAEGRLVPILRKHEDIITKIAATKLKPAPAPLPGKVAHGKNNERVGANTKESRLR
ncbi:hypothetical protein HPB50_008346 [Hyalomma asiaticum]|uniref:Uncharacterized protein n=1 Tax=Hyalomma asiaticum TaxID=266040 RepID=A0ACB7SU97_HYAAI|nr:hypothetical protein HPB50_008346 [Hyalomma asiaticum]